MTPPDDELIEQLNKASAIVERSDVPEDLREVAFRRVLEVIIGQSGSGGSSGAALEIYDAARPSAANDIDQAAKRLRLAPELLSRVVEFDEDGIHILTPRSRFDRSKRGATQQVALLVASCKQAAGLEEWTPMAEIRQACSDLGVDDPGNFATHIKRMEGVRRRGSRQSAELKVNAVGFELAGQLVTHLGDETQ